MDVTKPIQARYFWDFVLNLDNTEKELKEIIAKKITFGVPKKIIIIFVKKYKIKSFCKINLTLNIIKKLSNGYHIIRSIITFSNLHDLLTLYEIKAQKDKVVFTGRYKK